MRALVTGATGFVGSRLTASLSDDGFDVRCLVRDRAKASWLETRGCELVEGNVSDPSSLSGVGRGVDVAYYLVHLMESSGSDFARREEDAANAFAQMCLDEGVQRVVYLGGLGDRPSSRHLASRHRTAEMLRAVGPPLTYLRAGMVVGPGSASYETLKYLVKRLPIMIHPSWLKNRSQPIGVDDIVTFLKQSATLDAVAGREVQVGGPDVLTYGEMLGEMAEALGKRPRPAMPVPLLSPYLSSLWVGLVTPVNPKVARPLVESLAIETIVTDPTGMELYDVRPRSFAYVLDKAVREDLQDSVSAA